MTIQSSVLGVVVVVVLVVLAMAVRIVKQYESGVLFRLSRAIGQHEPGLRLIIPFVDVLHGVSLRIVTMPIQSHAAVAQSANPRRTRRGQEHHGGVPRPVDVDHLRTRSVPGPRGHRRDRAAATPTDHRPRPDCGGVQRNRHGRQPAVSVLVQFLPLIVYSHWMLRCGTRSRPAITADGRAPRAAAAIGLEDDPNQWRAWTALDERQLIRLLTDSAPRHRPAPNCVDQTTPPTEHKDTP